MNLKGLLPQDVEYLHQWESQVQVTHRFSATTAFLFRVSVMRVLVNEWRDQGRRLPGDGWYDPTPSNAQVTHIVDWLCVEVMSGAPWLENVDERGRPRKLLKCKMIDDLMREADKAMDRRNGGRRAKTLGPADEAFIADLGDGYTLVRMLTPDALDLESERMHHCVGHGAYDASLKSGWSRYLSVRNRKRRPVATIELRQEGDGFWSIRQIEGRRNTRPAREVMDVLKEYAVARDWLHRTFWWPVVELDDGTECDLDCIPEDATIREIPLLTSVRDLYPDSTLPDGLTMLCDLTLSPLTKLPERLTVRGVMEFTRRIAGDPLIRLPESLDAKEIRVGSLDDIEQPIPAHLVHRIRYRIRKLAGHIFSDMRWVEEDRGIDDEDEDEPTAPRL